MKPLIAITPATDDKKFSVSHAYCDMVEAAGGVPLILPYAKGSDIACGLSLADGLILSGGGDIHSRYLDEPLHPKASGIFEARDTYEIALCQMALARDMPIFGICRGMQILNVALGGGIFQHIEGHSFPEQRGEGVHAVTVAPHSHLYRVVYKTEIHVNSVHHQAVSRLGDGLVVSAAAGGVVEAIELPGKNFVLGVQWHPEALIRIFSEQFAIAEAFIAACR